MAASDKVRKLVDEIELGSEDPVRELHAALVTESDVQELRRLLKSSNSVAVGAGLFLASELGALGASLWDAVIDFSRHTDPFFRVCFLNFYANSKLQHPTLDERVKELLNDLNLHVRVCAIFMCACLEPERFLSLGRVVLGNGRVLLSDLEAHLERVSPHDRSAKALGIAYLLKLRTDRDEIVSACKFEAIYTIEQIRKYNGYIRKLGADRHLSRPRGNSSTDVLQ